MQQHKNDKMRVAIYYRVAHNDNADSCAIDAQRQLLRSFAKEQGFSDYTEYADNATNGLTLDRPAFMKMCEDIRKGILDVVLVKNVARIGRDMILVRRWLKMMKESGVGVISVQEGLPENVRMPFAATKSKRASKAGPAA